MATKSGCQAILGSPKTGRQQAAMTARWLRSTGLRALYSSPLRRARETADHIAAATGLPTGSAYRSSGHAGRRRKRLEITRGLVNC
jgi:broad specificity phosphatase PhoE